MPVTMTWNIFGFAKPKHEQSIIWLKVDSSFGAYGFDPCEVTAEYQWVEVDEDGYETGISTLYENGDTTLEGNKLVVLADGWEMEDTDLWMATEEYDAFMEANIPALK